MKLGLYRYLKGEDSPLCPILFHRLKCLCLLIPCLEFACQFMMKMLLMLSSKTKMLRRHHYDWMCTTL